MSEIIQNQAGNMAFFKKKTTKVFESCFYGKENIIIQEGGSRSGKTWAIMQCLLVHCITQPGITCTIVGQDVPNLKKGPMTDLNRMLQMDPHLKQYIKSINNTDRQYRFHNGSLIEFNSYENAQDAHSGSRDYSFFNEANGIPYEVYRQVAMRTRKQIFIDYNPSAEFWAMTEVYKPKKYDEITGEVCLSEDGSEIREIPKGVVKYVSNYSHNPHVDEGFITFIESMKYKDPEYYKIYGKGLQGSIEGLVFKRIRIIPEWPELMLAQSKVSYGLDYGFSDDPNAMTRCAAYKLTDEDYKNFNIHPDKNQWKPINVLIIDELLYSTGMSIDALAKRIIQHNPDSVTWCDVNPLLTSELQSRGCILRQAKKPPGSIKAGIKFMQNYDEIWITARSLNGRKEAKNYKYGKTRDNENELEPIDAHNHFWDATRMAVMNAKYVTKTIFAEFSFS